MVAATIAGAGPPVVLLHGQGGTGAAWDLQIAALAPRFRAVALDLRGHGAAAPLDGPATMATFAADVAQVMQDMSLGACPVVGHSLGGMVALQLALDAPELVSRLVIVNSTALGRSPGAGLRRAVMGGVLAIAGMPWFGRMNGKLHFPEPDQGPLRERLARMMGACDRRGYMAAQAAVDAFDVRARLGEIACPVLAIHSEHDLIPLADKQAIVAGVKQGRLATIAQSRHVPLWDQPERLNALLLEFLG